MDVAENEPVIETGGLRMRYGSADVPRGVDLRVRRGEVLALLGPNGAGKLRSWRDHGRWRVGELLDQQDRCHSPYGTPERGRPYGTGELLALLPAGEVAARRDRAMQRPM